MEKIIILGVLTVFSMVVSGFYFIYKGTDKNLSLIHIYAVLFPFKL